MNYRHAFHAGNFADCCKHALLVWLIAARQRKPSGLLVLDTHAGSGRYDLAASPAARSGEWRDGIGKLCDAAPGPALAGYLGLVRDLGLYPGSPLIARRLLRPQDRLVCCEWHPEAHAALRTEFAADKQVAVHRRDAWEALGALLPPRGRRGLVLIDPPFEAADEFARLAAGLHRAHGKCPTAVLAAWYPVKHRAPVRAFHATLLDSLPPGIVVAELLLRAPLDPARLNGCGLLVVNPPFGFVDAAAAILAALLERLGTRAAGEAAAVMPLAAAVRA